MVCPVGRGKMAAIVRLLGNGNYPEITKEEAGYEKLAAQTIHWEFYEADEANLLEEEDMHVFDSRPLTDPLELVCCNACKKPVKASQYAAHAARCKLIKSVEEVSSELIDDNNPHKKPPRKWRKKLQSSFNHQFPAVEELSEPLYGDVEAVSESNVDHQTVMVSPFSSNARGRVQRRSTVGQSAVMAGQRNGREELTLKHNESHRYTLREFQKWASRLLVDPDSPAPMATKMYHFQGSRRLRSTLGQLYVESVNGDQGCEETGV